jgi:hypothetical protein
MAKAKKEKIYPQDEAPDLGSIVAVPNQESKASGLREYRLLSKDISLLNSKVTYCATGSTAYVVDTGAVYMFHEETKTWYEQ